ncbi:MAG: D-alanyl-D-alanine carboxypeptidase [Proteobacteria bacterium]|nr:D-alanyl-D-alanine carboxypeptidase [Pseudomonadota bacterium]
MRVAGDLKYFYKSVICGTLLSCCLIFAATLSTAATTAKKEEGFTTTAPHAILIEGEGGSVLFEKNADELTPPASLSKLMTAEVVFNELKEGNVKLDDEFLVSTNAWRKGGAPSGGSAMFAAIHSRVRVEDLLRGLIIQSGNDAAIALAEGIAGGEDRFARLMEGRARELGLTQSRFANATGLHDRDHLMTAREAGRLAAHIIRTYPQFYGIYGEREFTWNKIRQFNRNPMLAMNIGADGLKTGFTKESGYGLVGSAVQNDVRLVVVVMGLKSADERAREAKRLIEYGFRQFEARPLFAAEQVVGEARLYGGAKRSVALVTPRPVRVMVARNANERLHARIVYTGPVAAPVRRGQGIGVLKVWRGEQVALEIPLRAGEDVGVGSLSRRAFDAAAEMVIGLFRAGVQRI